jgi:3-deoxy-D-manno-octulosonic-acid transferase
MRYSEQDASYEAGRVLIIDNIGLLSSVYRYGDLAIIGGGFGKGIHNILEAAVWGIPVLFGPNYQNFREAVDMLSTGGAVTFNDFKGFRSALDTLLSDVSERQAVGKAASGYVEKNTGASDLIVSDLLTKSC